MSVQSTSTAIDDVKPLVLILDDGSHLDEWLSSHPPSRLGVSAAFHNGIPPEPIWVLKVASMDQLAELSPNIADEPTFIKANELVRETTVKVNQIQNNDDIPVRASSKSLGKSKKTCRSEVQEAFHDEIMLMAAEHPLWDQGRWTMHIRLSDIDRVFAELAKSLADGQLGKHGSIIALRARMLPFEESTLDSSKRPKTAHGRRYSGSSRSPASSKVATQAPLGIDIFFRPVWNSNAARDVLRVVAGASGRMASFCKSSLYSRLGIKNNHQLAAHTSLYNSKTLASPADAKQWVAAHNNGDGQPVDDPSGNSGKPSSSKDGNGMASADTALSDSDKLKASEHIKRVLEEDGTFDWNIGVGEPLQKKPRNGESQVQEEPSAPVIDAASPTSAQQTRAEVEDASATQAKAEGGDAYGAQASVEGEESQDEPMLPVRPSSNQRTVETPQHLPAVPEEKPEQTGISDPAAINEGMRDRYEGLDKPSVESKDGQITGKVEQSQTQTESSPAGGGPITAEEVLLAAKEQEGNDTLSRQQKDTIKEEESDADADGESVAEAPEPVQAVQSTQSEPRQNVEPQQDPTTEQQLATKPISEAHGEPYMMQMSTPENGKKVEDVQPIAAEERPETDMKVEVVLEATAVSEVVESKTADVQDTADSRLMQGEATHLKRDGDSLATEGKASVETLPVPEAKTGSTVERPTITITEVETHDTIVSGTAVQKTEEGISAALPDAGGDEATAEQKSDTSPKAEAPKQAEHGPATHSEQAAPEQVTLNQEPGPVAAKVNETSTTDQATDPEQAENKEAHSAEQQNVPVAVESEAAQARGGGVEMSLDELIDEAFTATPTPGLYQGGLEDLSNK